MGSGGFFWSSLAGILTGLAAVITAVTGLLVAWYQLDPPQKQSVTEPHGMPEVIERPPVTVPPYSPGEPQGGKPAGSANTDIKVGDTVLSKWNADGCLYPATVNNIAGDRYLVHYAFGSEDWATFADIIKLDQRPASSLKLEMRVYVRLDDIRTRWAPSTIKAVRDGRYHLAFTEDARCALKSAHTWARAGQIIVPD